MKTNLKLHWTVLLILGLMFVSCQSDDSNTDEITNETSIYNKWWYNANELTADIYFHSDGTYEQKAIFQGNELVAVGDWYWEDQNLGIMKIEELTGQAVFTESVWFKISNIEQHSIMIKQSINGENYTEDFLYEDEE